MRRDKVNALRDLAQRSGQWISMDPERWGEHHLDSLESELQHFLAKLPEDVRDEYEDRYIEKYKEWLYAMSRCFSVMVTGPAKFNNRKHERVNNAERNARQRLDDWAAKVIKRCNREERLTGWAEVERLQNKIDQLTELQEKMKAANKIVRDKKLAEVEKVDELMAIGFSEQTATLILEPAYDFQRPGFQQYQLSLNLAKIKDAEAKMKRHAAMAQKEDEVKEYTWGELHIDYSDERYRFKFDGKPAQEIINLLKSHAFKWSRANMAWQRQITPNSTFTVKHYILPELEKIAA